MRIVFFGTPTFAVPTLKKLLANPDIEVIAVVTQPDKRRGRGNQLIPSPVKQIAIEQQIPVLQPKSVKKNAKTLDFLRQSRADAFVVVAYGQILSPEILEMPRLGCINVHGSILPKYRGAAPVQWCIARGETETGITTMLMDAGMDTGPMLLKAYTPIALFDNAEQVGATLGQIGADLLLETLSKLDRAEITPIPQNNDDATYAPLIQKSDYLIHWQDSGRTIHDRVRGFYPNALTTFRGQPLKVMATIPLDDPSQLPPELQTKDLSHLSGEVGSFVTLWKNFGPVVQTGEGLLLLKEVQLSGKPPRSGGDLVNGSRLTIGETFGQ
ncbi:MAG: methionyl-tRNA formyltransferase [Microcystis aeruginosa W11-06]|nr:methionyl-tRNA formyltransferase [Microcystis aeruginosa W11-03]NCR93688.1 methionyl-tRNA formyltransferase [Microcystis aeruginosa W11-06]